MSVPTTYQWLEPKPYKKFTKQLGIRGRNMIVWNLVTGIVVRGETPEYVAEDYHLPVEAVREALDYYHANKEWINAEVDEIARKHGLRSAGMQLYLDDCADADLLVIMLRQGRSRPTTRVRSARRSSVGCTSSRCRDSGAWSECAGGAVRAAHAPLYGTVGPGPREGSTFDTCWIGGVPASPKSVTA
jgi:uncharacterized protein (DUF433 family)